jgi:hypothetical protein
MGTHGCPPKRVLEVPDKWTRPASRPEDRGILSVIAEGDLLKSITDPDEGPTTSNGNPGPPDI